jgi:hypothetical protein
MLEDGTHLSRLPFNPTLRHALSLDRKEHLTLIFEGCIRRLQIRSLVPNRKCVGRDLDACHMLVYGILMLCCTYERTLQYSLIMLNKYYILIRTVIVNFSLRKLNRFQMQKIIFLFIPSALCEVDNFLHLQAVIFNDYNLI